MKHYTHFCIVPGLPLAKVEASERLGYTYMAVGIVVMVQIHRYVYNSCYIVHAQQDCHLNGQLTFMSLMLWMYRFCRSTTTSLCMCVCVCVFYVCACVCVCVCVCVECAFCMCVHVYEVKRTQYMLYTCMYIHVEYIYLSVQFDWENSIWVTVGADFWVFLQSTVKQQIWT